MSEAAGPPPLPAVKPVRPTWRSWAIIAPGAAVRRARHVEKIGYEPTRAAGNTTVDVTGNAPWTP